MPESTFRMSTAFRHGRTKVDDLYFEAPFKLMTPFHDGAHTDCMVMLASPGFLGGDVAHIECTFGADTDTTMRTQSYEKVLDTADGEAKRTIDLTVLDNARAVFLPFPVIPFAHSVFSNVTNAHIGAQSSFMYADVVTCGRVGMGERWKMRRFSSSTRVYVDETSEEGGPRSRPRGDGEESAPRLVFADRLLLEPDRFTYTDTAMWREFTHCGMAYLHVPRRESRRTQMTAEDELVERIRAMAHDRGPRGEIGVSRQNEGIAVRLLTDRGDDAFGFLAEVAQLLR